MKRNLIGVLFVAGGLTLATTVTGFAQGSPADTAKAAIVACNQPALVAGSNLTGESAREANAAYLEATAALSEVTGEANFKIDELVSESSNPEDGAAADQVDLTAELAAVQTEACQAIAEIRAEYNTVLSELQAATTTPEQDKPEVQQPEQEKPEVQKPEQEKPEAQKQTEQNGDGGSND
jgi:hypothetical protein